MAVTLSTAARNALLDAIAALVDGGAGAGKLKIYDTTPTLLAELTMSDPAFAAASGGVLTANAITDDSAANATGTAATFDVTDSDDAVVYSGSVGTSGADLNLNTTSISAGLAVSVTSLTITAPNA